MSAVMTLTERDVLHVVSDSAFYDEAGVLTATMPKILPVPGANAVFATRGTSAAYLAVTIALEEAEYTDFDGLRRCIEQVAARCDELLEGEPFEMIVAGWSDENQRGEVLFRQTHSTSWHDVEPGKIYLMSDRAGFGVEIAERWDRDAVLAKFEATRNTPVDLTCGRVPQPISGFSVGGYVWHATVRPGEPPKFEVLREWPDVIGEKINSYRPAVAA